MKTLLVQSRRAMGNNAQGEANLATETNLVKIKFNNRELGQPVQAVDHIEELHLSVEDDGTIKLVHKNTRCIAFAPDGTITIRPIDDSDPSPS